MDHSLHSYTPALRFPDFLNDGEWRFVHGNELFEPIVNKNHNSELPILAITQDQGAVPRDMIDYKVIVSEKSVAGYKVVEVGDFIISLRSFQGGIEYSNYKGLCSPAYIILRKKDDSICNDFYRYYFKSSRFIKDLNRNLEGIRDGKMISYQQFSEIMLPFPPLPEQRRIAQALTALDELIAATNERLEQMKAYKKGLMQQLFVDSTGGGKSLKINYLQIPKLRFPEFYEEKEWEEKKLGEVGKITMGQSPSSTNYNEKGIGLPLIQGNADIKNRQQIIRVYTSFSTKVCDEGDIILSVRAPVGAVGKSIVKSCIGRGVCSIKTKNDYLYHYLLFMENMGMWSTYSSGSTFDSINSQKLMNITIPIPTNEIEQRKIALCLSSMDETINAYTEKVGLLGQYKKGLMQQMFPQNQMN